MNIGSSAVQLCGNLKTLDTVELEFNRQKAQPNEQGMLQYALCHLVAGNTSFSESPVFLGLAEVLSTEGSMMKRGLVRKFQKIRPDKRDNSQKVVSMAYRLS